MNKKIIATIGLMLSLNVAFASPGTPPLQNVDANFNSITAQIVSVFKGGLVSLTNILTSTLTVVGNANLGKLVVSADGSLHSNGNEVRINDTQGFSVYRDDGTTPLFKIDSFGGITNPSTNVGGQNNDGGVMIYDAQGVYISPYLKVDAGGNISNTDPVQNQGRVRFTDDVDIEGNLRVNQIGKWSRVSQDLVAAPNTSATFTLTCPGSGIAISGGYTNFSLTPNTKLVYSRPSLADSNWNQWFIRVFNESPGNQTITGFVNCFDSNKYQSES